MSVLVCKKCGMPWEECGNTYERKDKKKTDHYCSNCGSKKKPVEAIVSENRFWKSVRVKEALRLSSPDKFELPEGVVIEEKKPKGTLAGLENGEHSERDYYELGRRMASREVPITDNIIQFEDQPYTGNALIIGDVHLPFEKKEYLEFCKSVYDKYNCDRAYSVGDFLDEHKMSFHDHDPDMPSAKDELDLCKIKLQDWYKAFPNMKWCKGNHDERFYRVAYKSGIPSEMMKPLLEVLKAPDGWEYEDEFWINDSIKIYHGTGFSGKYPHAIAASEYMCNVVMGHIHSVAGIHHKVTAKDAVWGMAVGCGIDRHKSAFQYAKHMAKKPVLSCGVILNGKVPLIELMEL